MVRGLAVPSPAVDFDDDPQEAALRAEVAAWLATVARPRAEVRKVRTVRGKDHEGELAHLAEARAWQRQMVEAGYAAVHWPVEYGGRGLAPSMAVIVEQERARYDVPRNAFMVGIDMAGPTLMAHGDAHQQARWLPATLTGEAHWCQLFSEPNAGSDLASLQTRAVRDGDEWVVTGQKVWTSQAHVAQLGMLLARTDPDAARPHDAITFFVVDMDSPGIDVRPLAQIDGAVHFNEVFLDEVRIPADRVVGEVHGGWSVARTTLSSERTAIGGGGMVAVDDVAALARRNGANRDPVLRQELARLHTREELQRWLGYRVRTAVAQGRSPAAEGSVMKLLNSHHVAHLGDVVLAVQGAAATLWDDDALDAGFWQDVFLYQWSSRIGGGTEQIQRNIIAERILGLPRDPRPG
jgi:alkylation response protein AidB-like acyl-CoA dehydrogenase